MPQKGRIHVSRRRDRTTSKNRYCSMHGGHQRPSAWTHPFRGNVPYRALRFVRTGRSSGERTSTCKIDSNQYTHNACPINTRICPAQRDPPTSYDYGETKKVYWGRSNPPPNTKKVILNKVKDLKLMGFFPTRGLGITYRRVSLRMTR